MSRVPVKWTLAAVLVLSCDGSATGPSGSLCDVRAGVEVCVDRPEYGIFQSIIVTTRNMSDSTIFRDRCGMTIGLVRGAADESTPPYVPRRRCAIGLTAADILERAVQMGAGASDRDTLPLAGFVVQGKYRANVRLLAPDGMLALDMPVRSGLFSVFPSQN